MKRKTFLQLSSLALASPLLETAGEWTPQQKLKNWAGNIEYSTSNVAFPSSVEEAQHLVRSMDKLRMLGTRHCFNRIADSKHQLVSTKNLNKVISLDAKAMTVTVESGIKYGELAPYLHEKGYALQNLASLPHISIGGSCSTATHGSGVNIGNLSTQVRSIELIRADGSKESISRDQQGSLFSGAVVSLGTLGMISQLTLDLQPTYSMRQYVFENLPLAQLQQHFEEIVSAGHSVSLFTDWTTNKINEVWVKCLDKSDFKGGANFFGASAATKNLHPIAALASENCTDQMGVPGPWYERLPHFKMGFTPSSGKELQAEYFIPFEKGIEGIMAIQKLGPRISPFLQISEIRTIAADELWMSPCYKQKSVAIHFTWKQDWNAVKKLLPVIEKTLEPYIVRPHWGKLFTISPALLKQRYEKMEDFKKLVADRDPKGKFLNDFTVPLLVG
jgi:xylitol oxidase